GFLMAGIQVVSLLLIVGVLPESRHVAARATAAPGIPLFQRQAWRRALAEPASSMLIGATLIVSLGAAHFTTAFPLLAKEWFDWETRGASAGFAVFGFAIVLAQGGLVRPLVPRLGERTLILLGLAIATAAFLWMGLQPGSTGMLVAIALAATGGAFAVPCIQGLLSQSVPEADQGLVLGLQRTSETIGRSIGPLAASLLFT